MDETKGNSILYFPRNAFSKRFGKQFFTFDISDFKVVGNDSCYDRHAVYRIIVRQGKSEWVVERRFREFDTLYQSFKFLQNDISSMIGLPPKTCCRITSDDAFLEERREKLSTFLDGLLKELSQRNLVKDERILQFLELDPNYLEEKI